MGDEDGNDGGDDGDDDGEGMCRLLGVVDWWREGLDGGGQREGEAKREEREVREERKQQQLQQLQRQRNEQVLSDDKLWRKPALEECLNLDDFENVARRVMSEAAWAYYSSGADDEIVSVSPKLYLCLPFTLNCTPLFFFFSCRSMDKSRPDMWHWHRRCAQTRPPIAGSASDHASSAMSKSSTPPLPCSALA